MQANYQGLIRLGFEAQEYGRYRLEKASSKSYFIVASISVAARLPSLRTRAIAES